MPGKRSSVAVILCRVGTELDLSSLGDLPSSRVLRVQFASGDRTSCAAATLEHDCSTNELAAALRDVISAPLLGEKTWGLGTRHQLLPLRNGDGVILAVGRFRSPEGKEWNGDGLEPDYEVVGD